MGRFHGAGTTPREVKVETPMRSVKRAPRRPTTEEMHAVGRRFPPNHLHVSWMDYLYWGAELES